MSSSVYDAAIAIMNLEQAGMVSCTWPTQD